MRYIYLDEVKTHMGVTGTSNDTYIKQEIRHAEDRLDSMLSVRRLDIHLVEDERHDATNVTELYLDDLHVVEIGEILDDTTAYTQTDPYDIDNYVLHLESSLVKGKRKAHIDYAAGWNAAGIAKLTVSDYSAVTSAMTLAIAPGGAGTVTLTEGVDWDAATSNNATATSIADAINDSALKTGEDTATGVRAFALENVVYICDEKPERESSTITASALGGLSLVSGGGTAGTATVALTMDGEDFPEDLRDVLMVMVGSAFNQRGNAGVRSYKIGSKSVTYKNGEEAEHVRNMVQPYKRITVSVI